MKPPRCWEGPGKGSALFAPVLVLSSIVGITAQMHGIFRYILSRAGALLFSVVFQLGGFKNRPPQGDGGSSPPLGTSCFGGSAPVPPLRRSGFVSASPKTSADRLRQLYPPITPLPQVGLPPRPGGLPALLSPPGPRCGDRGSFRLCRKRRRIGFADCIRRSPLCRRWGCRPGLAASLPYFLPRRAQTPRPAWW